MTKITLEILDENVDYSQDVSDWLRSIQFPFSFLDARVDILFSDSFEKEDLKTEGQRMIFHPRNMGRPGIEIGCRLDILITEIVSDRNIRESIRKWAKYHIPLDLLADSDLNGCEIRRQSENTLLLINFYGVRMEDLLKRLRVV